MDESARIAGKSTFELCRELVSVLSARRETLAVCESLTAGLCAARIADVPGASAVLRGGFITYATDLKESLAGVSTATVEDHGVVSAQCVREMACGAQRRCDASWGLSLSGVAGPDSQDGHPAGTVFIGLAGPEGIRAVRAGGEEGLKGSRHEIREQAVRQAIGLLLLSIKEAQTADG